MIFHKPKNVKEYFRNSTHALCKANQIADRTLLYVSCPLFTGNDKYFRQILINWDFPGGTVVKNPPANAGDTGSSPGPGRSHILRSN